MRIWLLFPNQLFDPEMLIQKWIELKEPKIIFLEHPIYFGSKERISNFNKVKLVFHRASMKAYEGICQSLEALDLEYFDWNIIQDKGLSSLLPRGQWHLWDPMDHLLATQLQKEAKTAKSTLNFHPTPMFLFTNEKVIEYAASVKTYRHRQFYEWAKQELDILVDVPSFDTKNRKPFPVDVEFPPLPANDNQLRVVKEAKNYIETTFPTNYGKVEDLVFPVTHETSQKWFQTFLDTRFEQFAPYQDAMSDENDFGFHSLISPMLNAGLLDPKWILKKLRTAKNISLQGFETFARQLIGWREYARMLYLVEYSTMKSNYFNNTRQPTAAWYTGDLGLLPVDHTIQAAFGNAYLHHILRLMMMSNIFNLVGIHPDLVYKWFMEFACDSYDWVMINNVYSMGLWADGGLTMRKPYLSSGNYILKMSNFPKGSWVKVWKALFYNFLVDHEDKLSKTPYMRNLGYFKGLAKPKQIELLSLANKFIEKVTRQM